MGLLQIQWRWIKDTDEYKLRKTIYTRVLIQSVSVLRMAEKPHYVKNGQTCSYGQDLSANADQVYFCRWCLILFTAILIACH